MSASAQSIWLSYISDPAKGCPNPGSNIVAQKNLNYARLWGRGMVGASLDLLTMSVNLTETCPSEPVVKCHRNALSFNNWVNVSAFKAQVAELRITGQEFSSLLAIGFCNFQPVETGLTFLSFSLISEPFVPPKNTSLLITDFGISETVNNLGREQVRIEFNFVSFS
jgi:hypothetical protein